jgi:hypothetical protein
VLGCIVHVVAHFGSRPRAAESAMSGTLVTVLAHAARSKLCSQLRRLLQKPLPFLYFSNCSKKCIFLHYLFSVQSLGELSLTWPRGSQGTMI